MNGTPIADLSVVIPTRNAVRSLARTLDSVVSSVGCVIVADGGSEDGTTETARSRGARVVTASPGRGRQLRAGCAAVETRWMLILHADSVPQPGWVEETAVFAADPLNDDRAGVYRLGFDDPSFAARRTAALANLRTRMLGLPYGDQGLLLSRTFHQALGGFRPLPLMEDVDLARRIGKRRMHFFRSRVVTSAERYRAEGWTQRSLRNLTCLSLWLAGVPVDRITRLYVGRSGS